MGKAREAGGPAGACDLSKMRHNVRGARTRDAEGGFAAWPTLTRKTIPQALSQGPCRLYSAIVQRNRGMIRRRTVFRWATRNSGASGAAEYDGVWLREGQAGRGLGLDRVWLESKKLHRPAWHTNIACRGPPAGGAVVDHLDDRGTQTRAPTDRVPVRDRAGSATTKNGHSRC